MKAFGLPELLLMSGLFIVIPAAAITVLYLNRRLQSRERIAAIEKGVDVSFASPDPRDRAFRARRRGIVLIALGLGLIVFFCVGAVFDKDTDMYIGAGGGAIPILIGAGLLLDYKLCLRDLAAKQGSEGRSYDK
jgi:hypothetical protein